MDINDLISVVTVYRLQNFSEAAYQLSYTTSAISKQIRRVENELGFPIFNRGDKVRQVTLTEEGYTVITFIQEIVEKHSDLMFLSVSLSPNGENSMLRVGYPYLVGTFGEVDILSDYTADSPNVNIQYTRATGGTLIQQVADNKLDCAFIFLVGEFNPRKYCVKYNLKGIDMTLCSVLQGMYVGLPADDPLTEREEICMADIIDRTVAFWNNSNVTEISKGDYAGDLVPTYRSMRYYLKYCESKKITPKVKFFNTMSHNVFQLTAAGKVVIPVMRIGYTYEGVKFVRVSDWENTGYLFFIANHNSNSNALRKLRLTVNDYAAKHVPGHKPDAQEDAGSQNAASPQIG